jgi:hypothetical protein
MTQRTVELRLELLKKVGEGFSNREVVKHLVEKFGVTKNGVYYHFRTLNRWISQYSDLSNTRNLQFQVFQRYNHVYRETSFQYVHCQDHNARIGYLRTMLEAIKCLREFLPTETAPAGVDEIRLRWEEPKLHLYMWDPSGDGIAATDIETAKKIVKAFTPEEQALIQRAKKLWLDKKVQLSREKPKDVNDLLKDYKDVSEGENKK